MPALKNIRHEKFAAEVVKHNGNQAQAYKAVYPESAHDPARANASRLLSRENIRTRILELMQSSKETAPERITRRLGELIASDNEGIAMQAVNTGLKVYGCYDEGKNSVSVDTINVVFGNVSGHPDAKEGHTQRASIDIGKPSDTPKIETDTHAS